MLRVSMALGALLLLSAPAGAACFGDDDGGEISIFCDGALTGALREDGFGNVNGRVGGKRVGLYSDGRGEAWGRIGGKRVKMRDDGFGDVRVTSRGRVATCRDDGFEGLDCR